MEAQNEEPSVEEVIAENFRTLHQAIVEDDLETVKACCTSGIDVNDKFDAQSNPQHAGITPLALSCALNKPAVAEVILDNGADVNEPFATLNTTSLMTSCYHGHIDIVKLLLQHGANVKAVDVQQSTALGYAFGGTRKMEIINMLIKAGIDVNQKNVLGMDALLLVAGYGDPVLVDLILRSGADQNSVNDFGHTALHLAVVGKQELVKGVQQNAGGPDRALNRRDLDLAIQEWARLHRDAVGGTKEDEAGLAQAGRIMMSIGHQLADTPVEKGDEQNGLERRVRAVWKLRQDKLRNAKEKKKSGIWNLLGCGGGRSKEAAGEGSNRPTAAPPAANAENGVAPPGEENPEVIRLGEAFAHILRLLIDKGCEIDRPDRSFGMTALDLAIFNGDVESTAVLTAAGADPNHFLKLLALKDLYSALRSHNRKEVKDLLMYDEDLDVNAPFSRFTVGAEVADDGYSPLALAVREGDIETVKMLLKNKANVNECGPNGKYPLTEAVILGDIKMVNLLLGEGAGLEVPSPAFSNATPFTVAVLHQQEEVADLLIKKGARVDRPMFDGKVAVLEAVNTNNMKLVDMILSADLNTNFSDPDGFTVDMAKNYQGRSMGEQEHLDVEQILNKLKGISKEYDDAVNKGGAPPPQGGPIQQITQQVEQIQIQQQQAPVQATPPRPAPASTPTEVSSPPPPEPDNSPVAPPVEVEQNHAEPPTPKNVTFTPEEQPDGGAEPMPYEIPQAAPALHSAPPTNRPGSAHYPRTPADVDNTSSTTTVRTSEVSEDGGTVTTVRTVTTMITSEMTGTAPKATEEDDDEDEEESEEEESGDEESEEEESEEEEEEEEGEGVAKPTAKNDVNENQVTDNDKPPSTETSV